MVNPIAKSILKSYKTAITLLLIPITIPIAIPIPIGMIHIIYYTIKG